MIKAKSILKRSLAILLAVLTLMSVGLTSVIALSIDMAETAANKELVATGANFPNGIELYFKPHSDWLSDGARIAACFQGDNNLEYWYSMSDQGNGIYMCRTNSANYKQLFFCRMNGTTSTNNWDNKWNQTVKIEYNSSFNFYTLNAGWDGGVTASYLSKTIDHSNISSDLLAVLKGTKVMFYIGKPSNYGNNSPAIKYNGTNVATTTYTITDTNSNKYGIVCTALTGTDGSKYTVTDNSGSWNGNSINTVPKAGGAYLASGATGYAAYTVGATLTKNSIPVGTSSVGVTVSTTNTAHFNTFYNAEMLYYITSNDTDFTLITKNSSGQLVTSDLVIGEYKIYPVFYDGYIYARGNAMTLSVTDPAPKAPDNVSAKFESLIDGYEPKGTGSSTDPYKIPAGTDFKVTLSAVAGVSNFEWSCDSSNNAWDTTATNGTSPREYSYSKVTAGTYTLTYSVYSVENGNKSATATTKTIYVKAYDYFKAGDVVYFENKPVSSWTETKIAFGTDDANYATDEKADTVKLGDSLYMYTFTEADKNKYIEAVYFTNTGVTKTTDNVLKAADSYNALSLRTSTGQAAEPSAKCTIVLTELSDVDFTVDPTSVMLTNSVELAPTGTVKLNYTLDGSAQNTNANTDLLTYKYTTPNGFELNAKTGSWTPASMEDTTVTLTVVLEGAVDSQGKPIKGTKSETIFVTPNKFAVSFVNGTEVLQSYSEVAPGGTVTYTGATPTKAADAQYTYTFDGWQINGEGEVYTDPSDVTVNSNITFTAHYSTTTNQYTVTFNNEDDTKINDYTVDYGTVINTTGISNPTKAGTAQYTYEFAGWVNEEGNVVDITTETVTGDITLTASFKEVTRKYAVTITSPTGGTITVTANEEEVTSGAEVEYGTKLAVEATANKFYTPDKVTVTGATDNGDGTYTVTGAVNISATFSSADVYTVTVPTSTKGTVQVTVNGDFDVNNGDYTIAKGSSVTLKATANTGYKFASWTIEDTKIDGSVNKSSATISFVPTDNVTATATYTPYSGTVTFQSANAYGSVQPTGSGTMTYENGATCTATPASSDNVFDGWTFTGGTINVDFKVEPDVNSLEITVKPLKDDVRITATANFRQGNSIKVYTYSADGFAHLDLNEFNSSDVSQEVYSGDQTGIKFDGYNWLWSGYPLNFTPAYNHKVEAQLSSGEADGGSSTDVKFYIQGNSTWKNKYSGGMHLTATGSSNANLTTNFGYYYRPKSDTFLVTGVDKGNYLYEFTLTQEQLNSAKTYGFTLYSNKDKITHSDNKLWETSIAMFKYEEGKNLYTLSSTGTDDSGQTTISNVGRDWKYAKFTVTSGTKASSTEVVDVKNAFYGTNGNWLGKDEVWLYFNGSSYYATYRRALIDIATNINIRKVYNNGVNVVGYDSTKWNAFVSAYINAQKYGDPTITSQTTIDGYASTLDTAYKDLIAATPTGGTVTIIGSHGAMPATGTYYGKISFSDYSTATKSDPTDGYLGDGNGNDCTYVKLTNVPRNQEITVKATLQGTYASTHMVYAFVINGTEYKLADKIVEGEGENAVITYQTKFVCDKSATIVPVYFNEKQLTGFLNGTNDNMIKVYAKKDENDSTWGNYFAAYTWTSSDSYRQFGRWTGQIMIPDEQYGMYYTFVERENPATVGNDEDETHDLIKGITFNNYGWNKPIYYDSSSTPESEGTRYQVYDYYEFIQLDNDGYDNIVFELNAKTENLNDDQDSDLSSSFDKSDFELLTNFNDQPVGIDRKTLTTEQQKEDPALYIIRYGHVGAKDGAGEAVEDILKGSNYYIDTYIYEPDGNYLGRCKSYELLNLEQLKTQRKGADGNPLDLTGYINKPIMVDYASLTDTDNGHNMRYDGEWYGTKLTDTKIKVRTDVALLKEDNTTTNYYTNVAEVGKAIVDGEWYREDIPFSTTTNISAVAEHGYRFVGWYQVELKENGTYTIDTTSAPKYTDENVSFEASLDATFVAVFEELPEGSFTVNNKYYTHAGFDTVSPHAPATFGNKSEYSNRYVQIEKLNAVGAVVWDSTQLKNSCTIENVFQGDKLRITITTDPRFDSDYVYAWYVRADDNFGVNFEEIGTNVEFTEANDKGETKSFTFTYTVKGGESTLDIYSSVVHKSQNVTITYKYHDRFNQEKSYTINYMLEGTEYTSGKPSLDAVNALAPYVDDVYKKVVWDVKEDTFSQNVTNFIATAREDHTINLNFYINNKPVTKYTNKKVVFGETVEFYASNYDETISSKKGIWYKKGNPEAQNIAYNAEEDVILSYGNFYGLVATEDMTICFASKTDLVYDIVLGEPIYGREQTTDGSGLNKTDKVYVDYFISYLIPHFTDDVVKINGVDKTLDDPLNYHTPVQIETLQNAGMDIKYGVVLEMINTKGPSDTSNTNYETYYGKAGLTDEDEISVAKKNALITLIENNETKGAGHRGEDNKLQTYFYLYGAEDITNKNRVQKAFVFDNTTQNQQRYYNVYGYMVIDEGNGEGTQYYFSNQRTLNIMQDSIGNVVASTETIS
ncbi:MAG: hypothetical protein IJZ54_07875 [Clostridia bacterium]|nr:hypothetical protein [Clostridia bacterium]